MSPLPAAVRGLTPAHLRDDPRLRAIALAAGVIPPRVMHSREDAEVLVRAARGARRAVEIGVYEGASAIALLALLGPGAELHLIDPFGRRPDALPPGWGANEHATRLTVERARRRLGARRAPAVRWHVALSHEVAARWRGEADLVFIDGDHSREGCERDWRDWSPLVRAGGHVVFHDARLGRQDGRGLPGPTSLVDEVVRTDPSGQWVVVAEADRTVALQRVHRSPRAST